MRYTQEGFQDTINLFFFLLHFLGEVSVLEKCVPGVVLDVLLSGSTCYFPLLLGSIGALLDSDFLAMVMCPCGGALDGTCIVVVGWTEVLP